MIASTLVLALGLFTGLPAQPERAPRELVTVQTVLNTNTLIVETADDPMLWVTLLGVGTPEIIDPGKPDHLVGKADPNWLASWIRPGT